MSDDETTEEPVEVDRQQDDDRDHPQDVATRSMATSWTRCPTPELR
jgi:hypothetical protein